WIVGDARLPLLVLMAAVLALLALTVANIANLLLARASAREREMSIRAAIGASRGRLMRLLLLESLTLSLAGGVLGAIFAAWALDGLVSLVSDVLPRAGEVALDRQVLLFTAALATVAGLLFGLAPAAQSSRPDLQSPLRDSVRVGSAGGQRARKTLVVAQVALALVMLVSAALIVRSFAGLRQANLGFDPEGVATGRVALAGAGYRTEGQVLAFLRQLEDRLPALPGVASAAFTSILPLDAGGDSDMSFLVVGKPELQENGRPRVSWYRSVSAGYFHTMGMRMTRGRGIAANAPEAVVNEAFARRFWPGEDALGQQVLLSRKGAPLTVVGIVADARTRGPRNETVTEMFLPYQFMAEGGYSIVLRAKGGVDPASLIPSLRALLASIDRRLPLSASATLPELHAEALAQPRLLATLLGAFAVSALFLALLGIYGVVAYAVGHRTTEIGVRLALGATPGQVVRLVVGDGVKLGLAGLALGVAGGLAVTAGLGTLLYGVAPHDPVTYAAAAAVIFGAAALGSWLPARRASRISPTEALRG
ncbi:MAG: FtsX-like permease family protein, partial [Acidobacteria bacterium]